MGNKKKIALLLCFTYFVQKCVGQCQIGDRILGNFEDWSEEIEDIFRGTIISERTTNINQIVSIGYGEEFANSPPYIDVSLVESTFTVQTTSAFEQYEENETQLFVPVTINFQCAGGTSTILILIINIKDTNNNDPEFVPSNEFEFVIAPPLPPGFLLTGCLNDITVKDIDLTTSSIIFEIEENPYFRIEYDAVASQAAGPKMFKAQLSTTTFIRTFKEPVALRITATDVDETGDDPRSTSGIIHISGDTEFEFPEEPVFSQTLYFATYTAEHVLILHDTISLRQGFDDDVSFSLGEEYKDYFYTTSNGNQVSLLMHTQLPNDILVEKQIYLIIKAEREYTSGDTATIVVNLPEETPLLFENAFYEGSIVDNNLQLPPLILIQGYEAGTVTARVIGEYSSSFTATVQGNLVTVVMTPLSSNIIEDNTFISIPVVASHDRSETTTIITLEIIKDDNLTPVFDSSIYTGSYDPVNGLRLGQITFIQGFDDTVFVELHGEHKLLFQTNPVGSAIQLTSTTIPEELFEEQQITLTIEATKPRTVGAKATIIIDLPAPRELAFEQTIYRGTIFNDELSYEPILLSGYDEKVEINPIGEYLAYFHVTNEQNQVIITLLQALPENVIAQNNDITLTLTASGLNAIPTTTTVLLSLIKEDITTPVFNQKIYQETYHGPEFEIGNIFLTQGFDANVLFKLDDSEYAEYFEITYLGNSATIRSRSAIPPIVMFNEKFIVLNVIAEKPLTVGAHAAVVITFANELVEPATMKFSENSYVGAIENDQITFSNDITITTGYVEGTTIELYGDLKEYFDASPQGATVIVTLLSSIPEQSIPANRIIVLDAEASAPSTTPAHATLVIEYVIAASPIVELIFAQPFYTGTYTDADQLTFSTPISLADGYDSDVQFDLRGDDSQWFTLVGSGNLQELRVTTPIPTTVLQNIQQLVFIVEAQRTGSTTTAATIVISLLTENSEGPVLRFDQVSYRASLENDLITMATPITISEGFVPGVQITLLGDLKDYFDTSTQGATVIVTLLSSIPEESIPNNQIIVLDVEASAPSTTPAHATLVIEYVTDASPIVELIFAQPFYTGTYTDADQLTFSTPISLADGYDADVQFDLDGDDSRWFTLVGSGNSQELSVIAPIPTAVLQNNQQLVFVVQAKKPGSTTTAATIVISLAAEYTEGLILGFDQVSYRASLENDVITTATPITISEGFVPGVQITLLGDLKDYFDTSTQGATVIVTLLSSIPEESIPNNRIIVLDVEASAPSTTPAHATLVIEYVTDASPIVELIFAQPFYTGTYTDADQLTFSTPISLADGYDADVQFDLDGDDSRWFTLVGSGNSQELRVTTPIPTAVLQNNQQLVFVVEAQRPGSKTTAATIVISLTAEYTEGLVLGFDQVSYRASLENDLITMATPITISEGFVPGVQITLLGDLKDYFDTSTQGATVIVTLLSSIPEESIPNNRIIVLDVEASAPSTTPAHATLVIEYVTDASPIVELIFAQPFYTGTYTDADQLTFSTPISLADGYDADVQFDLDGDDSRWFTLVGSGNSQELSVIAPIPTAVLQNNQQLVFVVQAKKPGSTTTAATIVISLAAEYTEGLILGFDQVSYRASLENDVITTATPITISEGFVPGVQITLLGDLKDYFDTSTQGATVIVTLLSSIPEESIPNNRIIVLDVEASAPSTTPAHATLVIEYVTDASPIVELIFAQPFYTGTYTDADQLTFSTPISLADGYDADVQFDLDGDDSRWFTLVGSGNSQELRVTTPIPTAVLQNNQQLVFVVEAQRPGSKTTAATIVISLTAEYTEGLVLGFDQVSYRASLENDLITMATPITISEGFVPGVQITLLGDLKDYFDTSTQGATVIVTLLSSIPEESIPNNRIIVLDVEASAPSTTPAHATLVIEYVTDASPIVELIFAQPFYTGTYTDADQLSFSTPISLADGYDADVQFDLDGDESRWFTLVGSGNSQELRVITPIPTAVLQNNQQLVFVVEAKRPGSTTTAATIVISLAAEYTEGLILGFNQVSYRASLENDVITTATPITISEGFVPGVQITLLGDLKDYFDTSTQGATVIVTLLSSIPEESIPANRIIVLDVEASAPSTTPAHATLVIEYVTDASPIVELIFAQPFYTGTYTDADQLTFSTPISLANGYDEDVRFDLDGVDSQWFTLVGSGNSQELSIRTPIPTAVLQNNQQLVFIVEARKPGSATTAATIVISLLDSQTKSEESFDKVLFEGVVRNGVVSHETIRITGFDGTRVELDGVYSSLFEADYNNGEVTVRAVESSILPSHITHLPLEVRAAKAEAVLLLDISQSEVTNPVVVTFSSSSYAIRVKITDTGVVGQVEATADSSEPVRYSLQLDNVHLQERLSIDDDGVLRLSDSVDIGIYTFEVAATAIYSDESATATVFLTSEALTVCGGDIVMPPLIVINRDEEEPHYNLLDDIIAYEGCHYSLTNRWPADQTWVYVNETGLHTRSIDREDQSIAFMTLSQVQVEIILHCDTDETRVKRALTYDSPDPYDYGSNKWVLVDTIPYNSRRSYVNLIVNDINDNAPVFVNKDLEPIVVGYPIAELEDKVLPRSLAELQATDADIGENAALVYWSSEPALAVSPSTGFVHIRDGAKLQNNDRLTVHATDRNGQGLTGSIDITVKLLDESNILVVTVKDEFLNNEAGVLTRMSESLGYEIKVLRSVMTSENEIDEETTRNKREISSAIGSTLQLHVYGLINEEPVSVERLITDITNAEVAQVNIASAVSLEDHLAGQEICVIPGRDTGLLAATIVLSVLLFIVIALISVWFFLKWWKNRNYNRFNDSNSITSQNESNEPKPMEATPKPRLNIEELIKSEKRLQKMLDEPIEEVSVEPIPPRTDAIVEMPPYIEPNIPIVIQSVDKLKDASDELSEDEFGEVKYPKPKPVVTFNENVEKFIHVEDTDVTEASPSASYETYKF